MRVIVAGSRTWTHDATIRQALLDLGPGPHTIVHGGASGADMIADRIAKEMGHEVEISFPSWEKYGRRAGPIRNEAMVELGADQCLVFIHARSRGATDLAEKAERAGIPVRRFETPLPGYYDGITDTQHPKGKVT